MSIIAIKQLNNSSWQTTSKKTYLIIGPDYEFITDNGNIDHFLFPHPNLIGYTFVDLWEIKRKNEE